jgi:DNA-binding MarR family transcriptional regulator
MSVWPVTNAIELHPEVLAVLQLLITFQSDMAAASKELWQEQALTERALWIITLVKLGLNRPSKLIEYFDVKPSTMTFELNKLADAGLLERQIFEKDRRSISLSLTDEGQRVYKKMTEMLNRFLQPRVAALEPGELEAFLDIGFKIAQKMRPDQPDRQAQAARSPV